MTSRLYTQERPLSLISIEDLCVLEKTYVPYNIGDVTSKHTSIQNCPILYLLAIGIDAFYNVS